MSSAPDKVGHIAVRSDGKVDSGSLDRTIQRVDTQSRHRLKTHCADI